MATLLPVVTDEVFESINSVDPQTAHVNDAKTLANLREHNPCLYSAVTGTVEAMDTVVDFFDIQEGKMEIGKVLVAGLLGVIAMLEEQALVDATNRAARTMKPFLN